MNIREVNVTDNRHKIAELIFGTDRFIYPFWLDGVSDKHGALGNLIDMPGSVFYRDNLLVAEVDGRIIGVFCYLHTNGNFSYDYHWEYALQTNFPYVYAKYLGPIIKQAKSSLEGTAVGLNLCIAEDQRGKGYGKQMFSRAADALHAKGFNRLVFNCLANNQAALKVYQEAGCKVTKKGYGFNGFDPSQPPEVVFLEKRF